MIADIKNQSFYRKNVCANEVEQEKKCSVGYATNAKN